MVKAVIFDLDDTLISEKQYIISGYHHIAQVMHNRFKISEKEAFWELMKLFKESPKNVFNRFLDRYKIIYTKFVKIFCIITIIRIMTRKFLVYKTD